MKREPYIYNESTSDFKFLNPKILIFIILLILTMVVSISDHSAAADIYVNANGGSDSNNGLSPATAKLTMGSAVSTAASGDTVNVADGIYNQTGDRGITIDKDLTIAGQSQTGTLIDGQSQNRIFTITDGVVFNIQDLTIKNGGNGGFTHGGAVSVEDGSLTVTRVTFIDNQANQEGGAIYNNGGDVEITDSTFNGNHVNQNGGAIYNNGGDLTVDGSSFGGNRANLANTAGGAIYNNDGTSLTIPDSTFSNNEVFQEGGAVYSTGSTDVVIDGSTFTSNQGGARGGAVYAIGDGSLTVIDSTFTSNSVFESGGAIYTNLNTLKLQVQPYKVTALDLDGKVLFKAQTVVVRCTITTASPIMPMVPGT